MTIDSHKSQLFWATVGYAESWWSTDRENCKRIDKLNRKLIVHLLESIAREYSVERGLVSSKREPGKRRCLCDILNKEVETWPDSLIDRAERCIEIMKLAKNEGCFSSNTSQISAITKFMWFLRPEGWTVYDTLAAQGLNARGRDTVERMRDFYKKLEAADFEGIVYDMQQVIDGHVNSNSLPEYRGLPATRIIDRFLVISALGNGDLDEHNRQCKHFLSLRPQDKNGLDQLAAKLKLPFGKKVKRLQSGT